MKERDIKRHGMHKNEKIKKNRAEYRGKVGHIGIGMK
jgi:hypothetical protein